MKNFRDASIKSKLTAIMVLTSTTLVLLATLAITTSELFTFRRTMIEELSALADIIGASSSAALTFNDSQSAQEILSALSAKERIISATIYSKDGVMLAQHIGSHATSIIRAPTSFPGEGDKHHAAPTTSLNESFHIESLLTTKTDILADHIDVARPVVMDGEILGIVLIQSDIEDLYRTLQRYLKISISVLLASIFVAYLLSSRLQRVVSIPIFRLKEAMNLVSRDKNYAQRVDKTSNDELGVLIQGFNEMLDQIQDRDQMLQRHREQLEEQVFLRTKELSNTNLRLEIALQDMATAKDSAENASLAKSQFLAKMSHEIRTPMNGVLGMAELLSNSNLTTNQKRYTENVIKSGHALLHIVNDILDLSKIEAGKLVPNLVECNLRDIVEEAVELLAEIAYSKGLDIACQLPTGLSLLKADAIRLRQVVHNLIGNAIKFTDTGEVFANISVIAENTDTIDVRISVKDTGIGIKQEDQLNIFESFSQVDGSMARKYGGTGLGLTISKQLVEMMGGELRVNSNIAAGSTFWFDITLEKMHGATSSTKDTSVLAQPRILIVDPSPTQQLVMQNYLASRECRTTHAATLVEAIASLFHGSVSGDPYQLCIAAYTSSPAVIVEIAQAIKHNPALAEVKLVTIAPLGKKLVLPDLQLPIAGAATKPIRQNSFFESLCSALNPSALYISAPMTPAKRAAFSSRHVLVAEDNAVNREVAIEMLKALSVTADVVANGVAVLAALDRRNYDLVFMDCQMPEMDGFEATRAIRERERISNIENTQKGMSPRSTIIVALTANAMFGDRELCLDAGMNDHLSKPFSLQQLATVLHRWLGVPGTNLETPQDHDNVTSNETTMQASTHAHAKPRSQLDHKVLDQIRMLQKIGGPSVLRKLIDIYLQSTPAMLTELDNAIQNNAAETVASVAHRLKSSSANLGATVLAGYFREMEVLGRNRTLTGIDTLRKATKQEYESVECELRVISNTTL